MEIRNGFAVPHTETQEQVEVDMEYQKNMLLLHLKANPREVLVGWYATSSELNQFSALIQNHYGSQGDGTYPHPAVHLTVSTVPGQDIETRTYISAPVGVTPERIADSSSFVPVPYEIKYGDAEKSGLELISGAKDRADRSASVITDVQSLERNIEQVLDMLDRVSEYVSSVLDEETTPSTALGQFLLNALALAPKVDPSDIERDLYVISPHPRVSNCTSWMRTLTKQQQQPHPRRPCRFLPGKHHPNTDRSIEPVSDGRPDDGPGRWTRWGRRSKWRRRGSRRRGWRASWWTRGWTRWARTGTATRTTGLNEMYHERNPISA